MKHLLPLGVALLAGAAALASCSASPVDTASNDDSTQAKGGKGGKGGSGGTSGAAGSGGDSGAAGSIPLQGGAAGAISTQGGSAGAGASGGAGGQAAGSAGSSAGGSAGSAQGGAGGLCQVGGAPGTGGSTSVPVGPKEICGNGFDDDGNGFIDEKCDCSPGATQPCFPGNPALAGKGACKTGTQTCEGSGEFTGWGVCKGSVLPAAEVCDGANDENCDGQVDEHCGCCPGAIADCGSSEGACKPGKATCLPSGVYGACEGGVAPAPKEVCGNKIDDDCNGLVDEGCVINVEVNIDGDCVCSAPCPPQAPYPTGCQVDFVGGDERGCVAIAKNRVYFQEGNACGAGHLSGKLLCSSEPGTGLNAQNCPINKPKPTYGQKPSDCADVNPSEADDCYF